LIFVLLVAGTAGMLAVYAIARYRSAVGPPLAVLGRVTGFELTNQFGRPFSTRDLSNQVWLADIIFTRCPGPCALMTRNLATLQSRLDPAWPVRIVSLTADPEFDTPAVLENYGRKFDADFRRWDFVTGARSNLNAVAMRQLLLAVGEKDPAERENPADIFLHSTKWVVVDGAGRLRAVHEGTDAGSVEAARRDVRRLLKEAGR
jgi:protein SCO1/2